MNKIMTWRERIGVGADFPLHAPTDVERAMEAEIAALRAAVSPSDAKGVATILQAAGAMRMVRCHDGSGEPFAVYDKDIADRVVARLRAEMHALTAAQSHATSAVDAMDAAPLKALHAAVSALYFDDSSDFRSALGSVVHHLDPVLAGELLGSPKAAYDKVCAAMAASRPERITP